MVCALLVAGTARLGANPGNGTLTLVTPQTGINKLAITVSATSSGTTVSDTETTNVTGTVNGSVDADPATGATTAMTITGGDIAMSNMHFVLKAFFVITVADISTANMGGTAYTPEPVPAPATPTATGGTFDAALHHVVINRGTMTGTVNTTTPPTPVNSDFATSPVEGAGTGTGTLTMVPGAADATHRTFQATVVLPVDFAQTQDMSGTPVTIKVKGTIKATGPVRIPLNALAAPGFSPAAGACPAGQVVTITGDSGSTIFYRINGGAEQSGGSPVSGPTVPAYPETLKISAFTRKSGMTDSPVAEVSYSAPSPFGNWVGEQFPGVNDPAITGPEADPDHDGQPNFFEFALGSDPDDPAATALVHSRIDSGGPPETSGKLLVTIAVRSGTPAFAGSPSPGAAKDGVNYTVEGSVDLTDYSAAVLATAPEVTGLPPVPDGYEYRSFNLDRAANLGGMGFLRVRVTAAP